MTNILSFTRALVVLLLISECCLGQNRNLDPNQGLGRNPSLNLSQQYQMAIESAVANLSRSLIRFETIGGLEKIDGEVTRTGPSTGLVLTPDGYAISAAINFAHQPTAIFARTMDGEKRIAKIIAHDFSRNLVLLKLDHSHEFPVPRTVSRNQLSVGQTVIAVGRASDRSTPNLSRGIISATHRIWDKAIQTDAKISAANFGGPLIDLQGRVAGILVPLSPDTDNVSGGSEWYDSGVGFAVPLDEILARMKELKSGLNLRSGRLGVTLAGTDLYTDPALVAYCPGSTPAWDAEAFLFPWRKCIAEKNFFLLVPQSLEEDRWQPQEVDFVTKALANLLNRHSIESARICVGGRGAGGAMASLIAQNRRDLFRGLILLDTGFAQRVELKTSPVQPLLVLAIATSEFKKTNEFKKLVEQLKSLKLPHHIDATTSGQPSAWIETVTGWATTVDRL